MAAMFLTGAAWADAPVPIGTSTITVEYPNGTPGGATASGMRNYTGSLPGTPLAGADNLSAFNAVNTFGRRTALTVNPAFANVIGPNEALVAHAFFKNPGQRDQAFFPGLEQGGSITLHIEGIQFDRPVTVNQDTLMVHMLWDANQNLELGGGFENAYRELNDHYTTTGTFRDLQTFKDGGIFTTDPVNFVLDSSDVDLLIDVITPSSFNLNVTIPYALFKNLEEHGQNAPGPGLPAPQGFLEPFHFHVEYTVAPEPITLALLLPGAVAVLRRKRR